MSAPYYREAETRAWWQRRDAAALLMLIAALPLVWPDIPPLVDLPGHMGRYRVQLDLASSPELQSFYRFEWALIGNLGVDLAIIPLSKLIGLEAATKLIVLTIPPLTVGGLLWIAREIHGEVPPTALFALPFAYNFPFIFGFVNFALSMALAMLAFALWLRLSRQGRLRLRFAMFVPISLLLWVTHIFGWGTLGLMAFSAESVRHHDRGGSWPHSLLYSALHCLSMALPMALMLAWRGGVVAGQTGDWFNFRAKLGWLFMAFRDSWSVLDLASLFVILVLILRAFNSRRTGFSRNLAASALMLAAVFLLLPRIVFGSAYADMRLVPYMLAITVVAIRLKPGFAPGFARGIAWAGLVFVLLRFSASAVNFHLYDRDYDRELAALDHVPRGARLVSFVGSECRAPWRMTRLEHLPALAIVRRHAFSNDQWAMAGAQLLSDAYPAGGGFTRDPSQLVVARNCPRETWRTIKDSLRLFPREAFDYVWLIRPPPFDPELARGLEPIWRSGSSTLYRVADRSPAGRPERQ